MICNTTFKRENVEQSRSVVIIVLWMSLSSSFFLSPSLSVCGGIASKNPPWSTVLNLPYSHLVSFFSSSFIASPLILFLFLPFASSYFLPIPSSPSLPLPSSPLILFLFLPFVLSYSCIFLFFFPFPLLIPFSISSLRSFPFPRTVLWWSRIQPHLRLVPASQPHHLRVHCHVQEPGGILQESRERLWTLLGHWGGRGHSRYIRKSPQ